MTGKGLAIAVQLARSDGGQSALAAAAAATASAAVAVPVLLHAAGSKRLQASAREALTARSACPAGFGANGLATLKVCIF